MKITAGMNINVAYQTKRTPDRSLKYEKMKRMIA